MNDAYENAQEEIRRGEEDLLRPGNPWRSAILAARRQREQLEHGYPQEPSDCRAAPSDGKGFHIIEAPQRSAAWFAARAGRLTGSCASTMLSKGRKVGEESVGRRNLRLKLALERIVGRSLEDDYMSAAMKAGIEKEPLAREAYEIATGNVVFETGFLAHDTHLAGASLDGHLGDFGELVSIKCREWAAHLDFLRTGMIPKAALDQMRHEIWITGANKHHYVSWNPDFPPELQLKIAVLQAEALQIPEYELAARLFIGEVDAEVQSINALRTAEVTA